MKEKPEKIIGEAKELISKNQTEQAIKFLRASDFTNIDFDNQLILFAQRLTKISTEENLGIVTKESATVEKNRINFTLLNLLSEQNIDPDNNLYPDLIPNLFIDPRDGKTYKTIEILNRLWMTENLRHNSVEGCNPTDGKYGTLYDWRQVKKAVPSGWRLPEKNEIAELIDFFGGPEKALGALRPEGNSGLRLTIGDGSENGLKFHFAEITYWTNTIEKASYSQVKDPWVLTYRNHVEINSTMRLTQVSPFLGGVGAHYFLCRCVFDD